MSSILEEFSYIFNLTYIVSAICLMSPEDDLTTKTIMNSRCQSQVSVTVQEI